MSDLADDPWGIFDAPSVRTPRTLETRQTSERKRVWQPSQILPDPMPQDGWVFKWCRTESRNQMDHRTFQKRLREGWEPVKAEDHPEMMTEIGVEHKTGNVEVGGLVLCKMPEDMVLQRARHFRDKAVGQQESAETNFMRDSDERMRKVAEKRRQVVFGRGADR